MFSLTIAKVKQRPHTRYDVPFDDTNLVCIDRRVPYNEPTYRNEERDGLQKRPGLERFDDEDLPGAHPAAESVGSGQAWRARSKPE